MTQSGWREAVIEAVTRDATGDSTLLDLMAKLLAEQDAAKDALRLIGFGVTGTPWPNVVAEIGAFAYRP